MKNQKGFIQVILVLIIVIVAIGGAYYFGTLKTKSDISSFVPTPTPDVSVQQTPVPTVNPVIDPTANWKTYTNNEFSFKYPNNIFLYTNFVKDDIYLDTKKRNTNSIGSPMELAEGDIWLTVHTSTALETDIELSKRFVQSDGAQNISAFQIHIINSGKLYQINMQSFLPTTLKKNEVMFDQILSTFKFINK